MKTLRFNYISVAILFLCLFITDQAYTQVYQFPSQERVTTLLDQIDSCKSIMAETEALIKTMEADPESYSLAEYNSAKKLIDRAKACIYANRKELESIRKEYPGWFNEPSVSMPLGKGETITPRQLEHGLSEIEAKIKLIISRMEAISKPNH